MELSEKLIALLVVIFGLFTATLYYTDLHTFTVPQQIILFVEMGLMSLLCVSILILNLLKK